tara:strand:+ start:1325 stop:1540 length:216 start_codon:yes stop_codon:yes gene_type:complete
MILDTIPLQIGGKKGKGKRGGTTLADASVPAGLFLLHKYMKKRQSKKVGKKNKKSKKSTKKKVKKTMRRRR